VIQYFINTFSLKHIIVFIPLFFLYKASTDGFGASGACLSISKKISKFLSIRPIVFGAHAAKINRSDTNKYFNFTIFIHEYETITK